MVLSIAATLLSRPSRKDVLFASLRQERNRRALKVVDAFLVRHLREGTRPLHGANGRAATMPTARFPVLLPLPP